MDLPSMTLALPYSPGKYSLHTLSPGVTLAETQGPSASPGRGGDSLAGLPDATAWPTEQEADLLRSLTFKERKAK